MTTWTLAFIWATVLYKWDNRNGYEEDKEDEENRAPECETRIELKL